MTEINNTNIYSWELYYAHCYTWPHTIQQTDVAAVPDVIFHCGVCVWHHRATVHWSKITFLILNFSQWIHSAPWRWVKRWFTCCYIRGSDWALRAEQSLSLSLSSGSRRFIVRVYQKSAHNWEEVSFISLSWPSSSKQIRLSLLNALIMMNVSCKHWKQVHQTWTAHKS